MLVGLLCKHGCGGRRGDGGLDASCLSARAPCTSMFMEYGALVMSWSAPGLCTCTCWCRALHQRMPRTAAHNAPHSSTCATHSSTYATHSSTCAPHSSTYATHSSTCATHCACCAGATSTQRLCNLLHARADASRAAWATPGAFPCCAYPRPSVLEPACVCTCECRRPTRRASPCATPAPSRWRFSPWTLTSSTWQTRTSCWCVQCTPVCVRARSVCACVHAGV